MINIEIHGFSLERGRAIRDSIFDLLRKEGLTNDVVVGVYPIEVFDRRGEPQQFLRVMSPEGDDISRTIQKLKNLGLSIEQSNP
jgi:hypothetical protein